MTVYYTVSGTATQGSDYTTLSGSVLLPAGQPSATISVAPINDSLYEDPETVQVTLSSRTSYFLGGSREASITIADDDPVADRCCDRRDGL